MTSCRDRGLLPRGIFILIPLALFACAVPQAAGANPFIGTWANAENDTITIRQDTVVENQPNGQAHRSTTPVQRRLQLWLFPAEQRNIDWNVAAATQPQPEFVDLLVAPTYPVASLRCDQGDHTYVLLNDRELVAIYRDGDIGVVERLARR